MYGIIGGFSGASAKEYVIGNFQEEQGVIAGKYGILIAESEPDAFLEDEPSTSAPEVTQKKSDSAPPVKKEIQEQPKIVHSNEVVVSATKIEKELQEVPMSVSVITAKEIQESNAQTVGDALKDIAGVEVSDSGSQGLKRISIRGEGASRTLILIDGQRVTENKSMDGAPILIDPSRIERIEVIKGPSSVLYGADATGGVINIITKKGGTKPIQGEIHGGYSGAGNGFSEGMSLFGKYKGFSYRATVNQNDQGNLRTPNGIQNNTGFSATDASIYMDYEFLEKYKVGIAYDFFRTNIHSSIQPIGLNGTKYLQFEANIPEWERNKISTFFEVKNIASYMSRIRLDVFVQENKKEFFNIVQVDSGIFSPTVSTNSVNTNKQVGASLQTDWLIADEHLLIVGYDFGYDILDTTGNAKVVLPFGENMTKYSASGYTMTNSLYAQAESPLPQDFVLSYGMRYTFINSGITDSTGKLTGATDVVVSSGEKFYSHPVFNIGLTWSGVQGLTLRLLGSQGFRAPILQERFLNTAGAETILANSNLKPETSNTVEVGARYSDYGVSLDIALFYTFSENYIVALPVAGNAYKYSNVGKAQAMGVELSLGYLISAIDLTPYVSGTFIKREFNYGTFKTWDSGTPEFTGRFGLRYDRDFPTQQLALYVDGYGRFASNTVLEQPKGVSARETISVASSITANINAGVRFGKERQYFAELSANNLFNTLYISPMAVNQVGAGYIYEPGFFMAFRVGARF